MKYPHLIKSSYNNLRNLYKNLKTKNFNLVFLNIMCI